MVCRGWVLVTKVTGATLDNRTSVSQTRADRMFLRDKIMAFPTPETCKTCTGSLESCWSVPSAAQGYSISCLLWLVCRDPGPPDQTVDGCCLLVGCLTSQQYASVSQGQICSDSCTCCHTEIEVADPTLHLTQSQYTDTGPTSPITDPITPGVWQGSHWSASF